MDLREPVSSVSHLLTAAWGVFATLVMWRMAARRPGLVGPLLLYGTTMVLLFLASGTFHGLHYDTFERFRFFQKLDQSAIYLFIAGTATPVLSVLLTGLWRRWFLRLIWMIALAGVGCMWLLPEAPHAAIVGLYLGLGWLTILPMPILYRALGWRPMNWVWVGAALYSIGAICELAKWPKIVPGFGYHEVLHLTHSAATVVFFLFIVRYVIPYRPDGPRAAVATPLHESRAVGVSFSSVVKR
jgi:hemolysin III